ncbi:hypothetical protein FTUN_7261 [Frigoriglobus tundricola]|uniref:Uncharacterized protein n=1 Tax=Frigoriglobus tundricola TaxID=2774151 RepID=A0A6M5Z357_9BACT|nr:hypothetical protein FTUN_7261 [Frigoriglobus tundricola]
MPMPTDIPAPNPPARETGWCGAGLLFRVPPSRASDRRASNGGLIAPDARDLVQQ